MRFAVLSVSLALGFAAGYTAQKADRNERKSVRLFVLERSVNRNVVAYDARLHGEGFDLARPIDAYWILFERGGEREELSRLERRLAFGVELLRAEPAEVRFALAALPSRPVTVSLEGGEPLPILEILGQPARLDSIHVDVREGGLIPGVNYVEIRGSSLRDGRELVERLQP